MAYACDKFSGLAYSESNTDYKIAQIGCGQWNCEYCAQKLASRWRARIINAINILGGDWTWFTLTAHSKKRGAWASITNLRNAWDTLMKRLKRKFEVYEGKGKDRVRIKQIAYVRVFEQHKDGSFHIHAIANFHFGDIKIRISRKDKSETKYSAWLQDTARLLKIGIYTHADDLGQDKHAGYVASYVTKYMTKMSGDFIKFLGRVRRIQASQNLPKLPKGEKWQFRRDLSVDAAIAISATGKKITDVSTGEVIGADYYGDDIYFYPPSANDDFIEFRDKQET